MDYIIKILVTQFILNKISLSNALFFFSLHRPWSSVIEILYIFFSFFFFCFSVVQTIELYFRNWEPYHFAWRSSYRKFLKTKPENWLRIKVNFLLAKMLKQQCRTMCLLAKILIGSFINTTCMTALGYKKWFY